MMDKIQKALFKKGPFIAAHYTFMTIEPEELESNGVVATAEVIKLFFKTLSNGNLVLTRLGGSTIRLIKNKQKVSIL